MIIDVHGHVSAPTELWAYKANLLSARGAHGRGGVNVSDDEIRAAANRKENWAKGHLDYMRDHGTDVQLISPRPFQLMQSEKPAKLVHWFTEECNNIIHRQMKLFPGKWIGVCRPAANSGRSDSECDSRTRTLREAARFCRLSFESGSLRKQRHGSTAARRPLLVSAL